MSQNPEREDENRILGPLPAVRNSGAALTGAGSAPSGASGLSPPSHPAMARQRTTAALRRPWYCGRRADMVRSWDARSPLGLERTYEPGSPESRGAITWSHCVAKSLFGLILVMIVWGSTYVVT